MSSLPKELMEMVNSYVKETESEEKFLARWMKMSFDQKQELLGRYHLNPIDSYSDLRYVRFSLPDGLDTLGECERVLDYALLNEIPDYDGEMAFSVKTERKLKTKKGEKTDYLPKDVLIVAKSSDMAQLLYVLHGALTEEVMEEFEGILSEQRDLRLLTPMISHINGDPYRILDGPFFIREGSKNVMITSQVVYNMFADSRPHDVE